MEKPTFEELRQALKDVDTAGSKTNNKADADFLGGIEATLEWVLGIGDSPLNDYRDLIDS